MMVFDAYENYRANDASLEYTLRKYAFNALRSRAQWPLDKVVQLLSFLNWDIFWNSQAFIIYTLP